MEAEAKGKKTVVVRKIDIVKWESDVARQHRIRSIPHLVLYDASGNKVSEGQGTRERFRELD
ncbi:MAG: hypothetical protein HY720_00260 [Planctomycetes bacterium]|nr:hypothetical protein [Planctomycetota bacterium]